MKSNSQRMSAGVLLVLFAVALCGCKQQSGAKSTGSTNQMIAPASQSATNSKTSLDPMMKDMGGMKTNMDKMMSGLHGMTTTNGVMTKTNGMTTNSGK